VLKRVQAFLNKHLDLQISRQTLNVVRVSFFSVALLDWIQLFQVRSITVSLPEPYAGLSIVALIVVTILMIAGWNLPLTAALNYLLVVGVLWKTRDHYHVDHLYISVSLTFLIAAVAGVAMPSAKDPPRWLFLLLFLQIELVYFDSLFYKFQSVVWLDGLVFWYSAALPPFCYGHFPQALELAFLAKFLTYLALSLETLFPLILLPRFRGLIWAIGFGLHIGIVLLFPIPLFGLAMCALYLVFLKWESFPKLLSRSKPLPEEDRPKGGRHWGWAICAWLTVSQLLLIANRVVTYRPFAFEMIYELNRTTTYFTGLSNNNVYLDFHFTVRAPFLQFQVTTPQGQRLELPTFDQQSYPVFPSVTGRMWALHGFYMRSDWKGFEDQQKTWIRFVRGWCKSQGVDLANSVVQVRYHTVVFPLKLDFQLDDRVRAEGWKDAGEIRFDGQGSPEFAWREEFVALFPPGLQKGR
jgi:hypothetical protein